MRPQAKVVGRVDPATLVPEVLTGHVPQASLDRDIRRLTLRAAKGRHLNLSNRRFARFALEGNCLLEECDFSKTRFDNLSVSSGDETIFRQCKFIDSVFPSGFIVGPARFEGCLFRSSFKNWLSMAGEFINCEFQGSFDNCTFYGRPSGPWERAKILRRFENEIANNDFRDAEFLDTSFRRGVNLDIQLFPPEVIIIRDVPGTISRIDERLSDFRDDSLVTWWKGLGGALKLFFDEGQKEVILSVEDLPPMPQEIKERVLSAIA